MRKLPKLPLSKKDFNLVKGALRRAFSRSEIYLRVMEAAAVKGYEDPNSPRCKKWVLCNICKQISKRWACVVDHILPIVPVNRDTYSLTMEELVNAIFCDDTNLQVACKNCHQVKSVGENKIRREFRKTKNKP